MNKPVRRQKPIAVDDPSTDGIELGKRLIRLSDDRGLSLAEKLANSFYRMTWSTPLHAMRLKGKYPLKLLAVPDDEIMGDARAGKAMRAGHFLFRGLKQPIEDMDYARINQPAEFQDYIHSFKWLRDLAVAGTRDQLAPLAEYILRGWLAAHAETPSEPAWRADNAAWRILFWASYAPFILSSGDLVYRSLVLNSIARGARHLDRSADKAPAGLDRITAWAGIVAAAILLPGGEPRRIFGEAGLKRALEHGIYADGGIISRSPLEQLDTIMLLGMLRSTYDARREEMPGFISQTLEKMVAALLGLVMGDGSIGSWQGSAPIDPEYLRSVVQMSRVRTRPLRQARDWGYQRLVAGQTTLIVDAAPPPVARLSAGGCASTCALELSDGKNRIIVNCGGAALSGAMIPQDLARGLRTSAAHSTLVLADANSTAIMPDGALGKGVQEVELDRQEVAQGSRLEIAHDGYVRRLGFTHRRLLLLSQDGRELRGEDMLLPAQRRKKPNAADYAIRFHLGLDVEPTLTADRQGAVLRLMGDSSLWQFRVSEGTLEIEESCWVDGAGRPHSSQQLVVTGTATSGGASVGWLFKRSG
ncbi:heparinase II/III family protein [Sphingobium sufflavum]|uniref:heparinase II/III family protein n=1 Tax=Sphingobium sufflavum TaxID=1129547 RepID=UPI001F423ECC|nr:heparinase II/III family protein [Sphingobium sufflavum]MCE7795647.1 heparinase II/III family protein [Sphingobium sufflavum]